jgi:hypothetical protein
MLDERFKLKCKLMATLRAGSWGRRIGGGFGYLASEDEVERIAQMIMDRVESTEAPAKTISPQRPSREEKLAGSFISVQNVAPEGLLLEEEDIPLWAYKTIVKEGINKLADSICMRFPDSLYSRVAREEQAYLLKQLGL